MQIKITLQKKQREAIKASESYPIVFFGGAKGGGKSYCIRARQTLRRLKYPKTKGLIVRKTYPELLSNHIRMFFVEYPMVKAWYNKAEKTIYWPNGSTTEFSYLQNTDDVYTYQGREYDDIDVDEVTQHEYEVIKILRSSLRTTNPAIKPRMFLTGNPGGIGHAEIKRIFVDRDFTPDENGHDYHFVQAFVRDNRALLDADPEYEERLKDLPIALRKAYLEGDWNIFTGQAFGEFSRHKHVMKPIIPSVTFAHYLSMDWGYSEKSMFAGYLHAVIKMKTEDGQNFQRVITYKEWAGNQKTPHEWAAIIYNDCITLGIKPTKAYGDPAMFNTQTDGSKAISKLMLDKWKDLHTNDLWTPFVRGNNNRIARVATVHNWLSLASDKLPYWMITESCPYLIKTLPQLIYDENRIDDINTDSNDHGYDSCGYFLTQLKFISVKAGPFSHAKKAEVFRMKYNSDNQEIAFSPEEFSKQYDK